MLFHYYYSYIIIIIIIIISTFMFNFFSTYLLVLDNNKTNGLMTSSKYPTKYLELFSVLTNFEIMILSTLTSLTFIGFFVP